MNILLHVYYALEVHMYDTTSTTTTTTTRPYILGKGRDKKMERGTCVHLTVPMEDYRRCKALVEAYRAIHPLN